MSVIKEKIQLSENLLSPKKFVRRTDLTPLIRLNIAFMTLMAMKTKAWGTITNFSRQYMISRTFIYMLASTLEETSPIIFGSMECRSHITDTKLPYYYMLSLRLEGRSSIEAISTIMKRFGIDKSSVGSISQNLNNIGHLLPNTLKTHNDKIQMVIYLSDELFAKNIPILATVDPISSAILKIELADTRKAEDWKNHWECIEDNGYMAAYVVTDEGKGLISAHKEALNDLIRQPDTYHAIAHRLGKYVSIYEKAAYDAIQKEIDKAVKVDSAKSDDEIDKRIKEYEQAKEVANEKIELYDNLSFLYICLISELRIFDNNGQLRNRKEAEKNIESALSLLEYLEIEKITKSVKKIRRILPELLNYFDIAEVFVEKLESLPINPEALQALCLAWQWRKSRIKTKKSEVKKSCKINEQACLEVAVGYLQEEYDKIKDQVYGELNQIVQSSALVECINSIIRPYLNNSKNNITQETLNLIMFYHNHRRYKSGERRGKTPMEILTGKKQEKDWTDLLFYIIEAKDPSFFAETKG